MKKTVAARRPARGGAKNVEVVTGTEDVAAAVADDSRGRPSGPEELLTGSRLEGAADETGGTETPPEGPDQELDALMAVLSLARADAKKRYVALRDLGRHRAGGDPAGAGRALLQAWDAAGGIEPAAASLAALKTVVRHSDGLPPEHRLPHRSLCFAQIRAVSGRHFLSEGSCLGLMAGPLAAWERACLGLLSLASEGAREKDAGTTRPKYRIQSAIKIAVEIAADSQEHAQFFFFHALGLVSRFRGQLFDEDAELLQIGYASDCLVAERRSCVLSSIMSWCRFNSRSDFSYVAATLADIDPLKALEATFAMHEYSRNQRRDAGYRALILQRVAQGLARAEIEQTLSLARSRQYASALFGALIAEAAVRSAAAPRQAELLLCRAAALLSMLAFARPRQDDGVLPGDLDDDVLFDDWNDFSEVERRAEALSLLVEAAAQLPAGRASLFLDFVRRATEVVYEHNKAALLASIARVPAIEIG